MTYEAHPLFASARNRSINPRSKPPMLLPSGGPMILFHITIHMLFTTSRPVFPRSEGEDKTGPLGQQVKFRSPRQINFLSIES